VQRVGRGRTCTEGQRDPHESGEQEVHEM